MKPKSPISEPNEVSQKRSTPSRPPSGRFPKGTSGNPKGRPPGSRNRATLLMENLLQDEAENLTRKLIDMAKEGDPLAMRICVDRLLPPQKDRLIELPLGSVETLPEIRSAMSTVVQAVGDGIITPTAGETMAQVLHLQSEVITSVDLAPRVDQLEKQMSALQNQEGNSGAAEIIDTLRIDRSSSEVKQDAA